MKAATGPQRRASGATLADAIANRPVNFHQPFSSKPIFKTLQKIINSYLPRFSRQIDGQRCAYSNKAVQKSQGSGLHEMSLAQDSLSH
jgi:hypothetical protein